MKPPSASLESEEAEENRPAGPVVRFYDPSLEEVVEIDLISASLMPQDPSWVVLTGDLWVEVILPISWIQGLLESPRKAQGPISKPGKAPAPVHLP